MTSFARGTFLVALGLDVACGLLAAGCQHTQPAARPPATAPAEHEPLPARDPVAFLRKCLERYDRAGIRGYRLTMQKQERTDGTLHPVEVIEVAFRAHPYSVFLHWLRGARRAQGVLYVEGENGGKMLVRPTGLAGVLVKVAEIDPDGPEARQAGRYGVKDFGLRKTLERTLRAWEAARDKGRLHVAYRGVRKLEEAGDRPCYTLERTSREPDEAGVSDTTVYLDEQTWFQVGTLLKGPDGGLIGEYLYRDIRLNPAFAPDQFRREALLR